MVKDLNPTVLLPLDKREAKRFRVGDSFIPKNVNGFVYYLCPNLLPPLGTLHPIYPAICLLGITQVILQCVS